MLANHCICEADTTNNTAIVAKNSIAEPFEDMLIVFIHSDVIQSNKVVHQFKMNELIIDR